MFYPLFNGYCWKAGKPKMMLDVVGGRDAAEERHCWNCLIFG